MDSVSKKNVTLSEADSIFDEAYQQMSPTRIKMDQDFEKTENSESASDKSNRGFSEIREEEDQMN